MTPEQRIAMMKERYKGMGLNDVQTDSVIAINNDMRPKMMAIRDASEAERPALYIFERGGRNLDVPLHQHQPGVFDIHAEGAEEFGTEGAVNAAMIRGQRDRHLVFDHDVVAAHDGSPFSDTHGQDCSVGRVDDGGKILDAEHAEV